MTCEDDWTGLISEHFCRIRNGAQCISSFYVTTALHAALTTILETQLHRRHNRSRALMFPHPKKMTLTDTLVNTFVFFIHHL